jgi:superfamily II DNA or RNA helicase
VHPGVAMKAPPGPPRAGDVVRIRDDRWRVISHASHGETTVLDAAGCGEANWNSRARFLLPFEPIERLLRSPVPRVVRPARWRRAARGVLAEAAPSWISLRAAARANLTVIPFQLEPALAFVAGRACRFLLADGVGLGKTVQAGLMIAELLARQPGAHALVISPAALREQWRHELSARFRLDAEVFDAAGIARAAADLPAGINPWSLPRIIVTSIDFIKRPEVMRSIEALTWDFVAFDEAHNLAGRSDRAAAAQAVARRSRAVALLTATPHSGDDRAFQKLCGIGDVGNRHPLLMFRRTRADAGMSGRRRMTTLRVRPTPSEAAMHAALLAYGRRAWVESTGDRAAGARLAMTVLARRACSSAGSLARSVERRLALLQEAGGDHQQPHLPFADVSLEDEEPDTSLGSRGLHDAAEERTLLRALLGLARIAAIRESKLSRVSRFLSRIGEPAIVFTEYRDTLERLADVFVKTEHVQLHGGLTSRERMDAIARFTAGRARLLLATDAASEGLNLHQRCRLVINLELPWTPVRLDQRAGRVDRIGQPRTVHAVRLVAADTCEESVVARLASRADRIRDALETTPDEALVAESVFGAPLYPADRVVPDAGVIQVDAGRDALEEAERLCRARTWLASASGVEEIRPGITRLRAHGALRRTRLWAFRVAIATASNQVLWETVVAADTAVFALHERSAAGTRAMLRYGAALQQTVADAAARQTKMLQEALRPPLALWVLRELDVMDVMRRDHARMSATLLQAGLFDRRSDRAAAAQASMLEAALARCRGRLAELRACEDLHAERCDLAFAVILE